MSGRDFDDLEKNRELHPRLMLGFLWQPSLPCYEVPIGQRIYDRNTIREIDLMENITKKSNDKA